MRMMLRPTEAIEVRTGGPGSCSWPRDGPPKHKEPKRYTLSGPGSSHSAIRSLRRRDTRCNGAINSREERPLPPGYPR